MTWTCPFCSLLCDGFGLSDPQALQLQGSDCPRAIAGLKAQRGGPDGARVDGAAASLDAAAAAAAERLGRWRQPLFGGLATDVAGARALVRLAHRTGAVCDHADGEALMHGIRALQDRGQYQTTLGEIRERADLIVCVGTPAVAHYPEFFHRCGLGDAASPCRRLVFLDAPVPDRVPAGVEVQAVSGNGDLFADVQELAALVHLRRGPETPFGALAHALHDARYAVLVWEAGQLPAHGALLVEALARIVATLNLTTRAATFALGGSEGAYAVNQAFTWLTGLPLRTRAGPVGLEHDPVRFAADRLIADRAVDGVLWVSSFDPARGPPDTDLPIIVLGPPAMGAQLSSGSVFLPVATPGLDAAGHLFRTDGGIVVPLVAVREGGPPTVEQVVTRIADAQEGGSSAGPLPSRPAGGLS